MWKSKFEATGDQWRKFEITGTQEIARGVSGVRGACGKGKVESGSWNQKKSVKLQRQTIALLQMSTCFPFGTVKDFMTKN